MRTNSKFVLISAAGLIVAACSGQKKTMSDDLKKDLDLAATSDGLALAPSAAKGSQVVSAIERTTPPAPRQIAQSQRVVKHKPAPRALPAPVEAQRADVSPEVETQPVAVAQTPAEPEPSQSPRPHPIETPSGSGVQVGRGGGSSIGSVLGGIAGVILRGGIVIGDGDACDPRTEGRGRDPGSVNRRIPGGFGVPTFPGGGRVWGGHGRR
ncbi:MAG: hypothetical protein ABR582_01270 [Gemmatimonadaceae bacterium]